MRRRTFFEWWNDTIGFEVYLIAAVALCLGVIITAVVGTESRNGSRVVYKAWCAAHHSDISYEEWQTLRRANLLPGQPPSPLVPVILN
jgi:hypothetical protein